jgi:hypothetical protein
MKNFLKVGEEEEEEEEEEEGKLTASTMYFVNVDTVNFST